MERVDAEVLSVLESMDAEQRAAEQMYAARAHIRDVIKRYQDILAKLPGLEKSIEEASTKLSSLEAQIVSETNKVRQREQEKLEKDLASMRLMLTNAQSAAKNGSDNLAKLNDQLAKRNKEVADRLATLDTLIIEKEKELHRVTEAFDSFRKEHKL